MVVLSLACELKQALRQMTVAVGILVKIVLVVVFRLVEVLQWSIFYSYLPLDVFLLFGKDLIDDCLVSAVGVIDSRAVLSSHVVALSVDACRVNSLEIHFKQKLQRYLVWIVSDMDSLGKASLVSADFLVSGILGCAVGIAYLSVHYAVNLLEVMLSAPETTSSKIDFFELSVFHIRLFYVLMCICLT